MAVYLDTNMFVSRGGAKSLRLTAVKAICDESNIAVVVPELVADEIESRQVRLLETAFDQVRSSHRYAASLAGVPTLPELPNPGELAREQRRALESRFHVAPTPDAAAGEALRREAFRLLPARVGKGARDVAIWLTIREDHLARNEQGYLATQNIRDFGANGSTPALHDALANELGEHAYPLTLCTSLEEVARHLARSETPFIDESSIGALPSFKQKIAQLTLDPSFLDMLVAPDELRVRGESPVFAASEVGVDLSSIHTIDGYVVGSQRFAVAEVRCFLYFELGTLEKGGAGRLQRTVPVRTSITAVVWFRKPSGGDPIGVEVAHVLSARAEAM